MTSRFALTIGEDPRERQRNSGGSIVHIPVLADEALYWLNVRPGGNYVDCTAGAGGHAERIADALGGSGRLMCIDRDPAALAGLRERFEGRPEVCICAGTFGELARVAAEAGIDRADGVLIDAGVSSMQLDDPARGFSFQHDGPLDMRMDPTTGESAAELLARLPENELTRLLREYGDVGPARAIARSIRARREGEGLTTTSDLAEAIRDAFPHLRHDPDEMRTVFQAIRIAVNDEFGQLDEAVEAAAALLAAHGRLVVITFHSGEDRIVKNRLRALSRKRETRYPDGRTQSVEPPVLRLLTPKPVTPGAEERRRNPRAASAKLRAAEKREAA